MLLRGFDRDLVQKVEDTMVSHGINLRLGVLPTSITKLPSGRLRVEFSSGDSDEFDTVLCAVGRNADSAALGVDAVGIRCNVKNGKILCDDSEQTSAPNVYAIGDVVQGEPFSFCSVIITKACGNPLHRSQCFISDPGAPELTPSAILCGKLLARR